MVNKNITKVCVGSIHDFPVSLGKTVKVNGKELAVFKLSSGKIRAIENRCPHKGGVLSEGIVSGDSVFCPMHDWKICLHDGNVQEPDSGCVDTYEASVEGDLLYLLIEE
ncbi:nitrite reductase small subunit NirD [Priestia megaterium]|uniref:nitrite reductase small subunit NirD n=1 Tax=Priestia megaterium TaxID=1404 RepID=UPI0036DF44EA